LAGVHRHARREAVDQLPHEPGLPDPTFSPDEGDRRRLPGVDQLGEPIEVVGPTDHLG